MKKIFIYILLVSYFNIKAQLIHSYGFKFGLNSCFYDLIDKTNNNNESSEIQIRPALFFNVERYLTPNLLIKPEIGYSIRGMSYTNSTNEKINADLHFTSLNLSLKYFIFKSYSSPIINFFYQPNYLVYTENHPIEDTNKLNNIIGLGIGYRFNRIMDLELNFNKNLNSIENSKNLEINEQFFSFDMSINIDELIQSSKPARTPNSCPRIRQPR
jgi:hypothetical protein